MNTNTFQSKSWSVNDWADFWRNVGFNVIPSNGKVPIVHYKEFFDKPIPIELHNYWKKINYFNKGIDIINGKLWNHTRRKHLYGHTIDCDTEEATKIICNVKGIQYTPEDISKKGVVVENHPGTQRYHFIIFSEEEFPNLSANASGIEIKGIGKTTTVTPTRYEDGTYRRLVGESMKALENCVIHTEIMQHVHEKLIRFGINYLDDELNKDDNHVARNKTKIAKGLRHAQLLSYANSLIARLHLTTNRETIWEMFKVYNNKECEEPMGSRTGPEQEKERKEIRQIFEDSWNNIVTKNNSQHKQQEGKYTAGNNGVLSVLEAKRLHTGEHTVTGTIVSVSDSYVLELVYNGMLKHRNAKSIQLEDSEKLDENERLDVVLYDDMIDNVVAGETVLIFGNILIEDKKASGKSKKKYNVLHAKSIIYLNRKEVLVTNKDIQTFERFISYPQLIDRLVKMFAPHIIGHDEVKEVYYVLLSEELTVEKQATVESAPLKWGIQVQQKVN